MEKVGEELLTKSGEQLYLQYKAQAEEFMDTLQNSRALIDLFKPDENGHRPQNEVKIANLLDQLLVDYLSMPRALAA